VTFLLIALHGNRGLAISGVGTSAAARVGEFMHRSRGGLDHSHLSGLAMQDSVLAQLPSFDTEGLFQEPPLSAPFAPHAVSLPCP
jgi:hypothetical protein